MSEVDDKVEKSPFRLLGVEEVKAIQSPRSAKLLDSFSDESTAL